MKQLVQFGVVVAVCACLSGCDGSSGGGGGSNTPEAVAKAFAEIWDSEAPAVLPEWIPIRGADADDEAKANELHEKIKNYATSSFRKQSWDGYLAKKSTDDSYQFLDCKISGNQAAVLYTRKNETEHSVVLLMAKIDDQWKVKDRERQKGIPLDSFL